MPSPSDPTAALIVRDLRKGFGPRTVLDGVDLDVAAGSVVLLAGGNGSGKTTLLRCIAGLARFEGTVTLDGQPLGTSDAGDPRLGYLPQTPGLPSWATGAEVLDLFGRLRGCAPDSVALPEGFLPPLDRPIGQLSGGQRQRVAFAVALLGGPSLLLLDEPAANLDDDGRAALVAILDQLRSGGASVVIAAPSPADLAGLPDRTVRLRAGALVGDAPLHLVDGGPATATTPSGRTTQEVPA